MVKQAIFATASAAAALMVAAADKSELTPAFHNTVVSTCPDGRQARLWLSSDSSYTAQGGKGDPTSGRWALKGYQIGMKQSDPPTLPRSYCTAVPSGGVGTTGSGRSLFGVPLKVKLAGRS